MHLATQADIPFINEVMNHPKVRPYIWTGSEPIDSALAIEWMWTLVESGKGVMMAEALGGGSYLALVAFLPEAWGNGCVWSMKRAIRKIFVETDCERLYASVDPTNTRAVRNLTGMGLRGINKAGNRVVGHIDYLDILDIDSFRDTCRSGWQGKALYWWGIKSKIENISNFIPIHPELPIFMKDNDIIDFSGVTNG